MQPVVIQVSGTTTIYRRGKEPDAWQWGHAVPFKNKSAALDLVVRAWIEIATHQWQSIESKVPKQSLLIEVQADHKSWTILQNAAELAAVFASVSGKQDRKDIELRVSNKTEIQQTVDALLVYKTRIHPAFEDLNDWYWDVERPGDIKVCLRDAIQLVPLDDHLIQIAWEQGRFADQSAAFHKFVQEVIVFVKSKKSKQRE
jgi:hypothetical protein